MSAGYGTEVVEVPLAGGVTDADALADAVDDRTAAVFIQQPNFLGAVEDLEHLVPRAKASGALAVCACEPLALGILRPPGELGVDVAVGEGQPLGNRLDYGGPSFGFFAASEAYLRRMPGRIAGETTDSQGRRGFVLTLQTREQHIRREKATSNICTNSGLIATAATAYMCLMGPQGLKRVAEICYQRSHYLANRIAKLPGYRIISREPFFKEFAVQTPISPTELNRRLLEHKIIGGLDISNTPEVEAANNAWLLCVTEMNSVEQLDRLVEALEGMRNA